VAAAAARRGARAGSLALVRWEPLDRVAARLEFGEQPQLGGLRILVPAEEPKIDVVALVALGPEEPQLDPARAPPYRRPRAAGAGGETHQAQHGLSVPNSANPTQPNGTVRDDP
jgi:hypothetical protein